MKEREIKPNKYFDFEITKKNDYKIKNKVLNLKVCQDNSFVLISTENSLYEIIPFKEILNNSSLKPNPKNEKIKYDIEELIKFINRNNKTKNKLRAEPIFEINPKNDEGISLAIGIDKTVMLVFISRKRESLFEIEHGEKSNCKFIQWENDLLICAFENKIIKIIKNRDVLKTVKDDDYMTSMKIIHFQDYKLLVAGYNKKVIITNFYNILNSDQKYPPCIIPNLEGKIDLIEYYNQYILFCSKKNNAIYCFQFLNNSWRPSFLFDIFRFQDLEEDQEIINVKLYLNEGIIVSFKNKIYIFTIKNKKKELYKIIESDNDIYFFSLIYTKGYQKIINTNLLCVIDKKIIVVGINKINKIIKKDDLSDSENNPEDNKESINTFINTILNRKNDFIIKKIDDYLLQVEIDDDNIFKIEFNLSNKSANISIVKCHNIKLKNILEEELEKLRNEEEKEENLDSLIDNLNKLNKIIKSIETQPSVINNIKKDIFLEYYQFIKNWHEIMKKKTPINNLFKEEEDFDLYNKIMLSSFRELINLDFSYNKLSDDNAFDFVNSNSNDYSPQSLFFFSKDSQQFESFYTSLVHRKSFKIKKKPIFSNENILVKKESKKKLNKNNENVKNKDDIINDDKKGFINKLTKESFKNYINKINKNFDYGNIFKIMTILNQIKYYIEELIKQKSTNLINMYTKSILNIFTLLESQLSLDFLFICILPISSIIYNEIKKEMKRLEFVLNKSGSTSNKGNENRISNDNIIKSNKNISYSSSNSNDEIDDNAFEFFLNTEETKNNSLNDLYNNYNNESKNDTNKGKSNLSKRYSKNSKNSEEDFSKTYSKISKLKSNLSIASFSYKNDKNLIELLGAKFCNIIIDYVIFFSEELKLLNNDLADKNVIDFFILINKYYETEISNEINDIIKKAI